MTVELSEAIHALQAHKRELQRLGVLHTAVFGSVARGESRPDSDVDVLVELDPVSQLGVFEYSRIKLFIDELIQGADVVNRRTLKPSLKDAILRDAVIAF